MVLLLSRLYNVNLYTWNGSLYIEMGSIRDSKVPGDRHNIKMLSYQYRDPHGKDKTVSPTVLSLT